MGGLGWRVRHRCSERSIGFAPSGCSGLAGWSFTCRLRPPVLPDLVPLALGTLVPGLLHIRIILILAGTVFASLGPLYTFAKMLLGPLGTLGPVASLSRRWNGQFGKSSKVFSEIILR